MAQTQRVNHQQVFLLSSKPWRENSLWLEVFSREHGRLALLARSARTRGSELRGILVPFVPLSASWFGREELKTLHRAEWLGGWPQPHGRALFSALYANELLLKLTAREDPHPLLFDELAALMRRICQNENPVAALRRFEWTLLRETGYAPDLTRDAAGRPLADDAHYRLHPERMLEETATDAPEQGGIIVPGSLLRQLVAGEFADGDALQQAVRLTRLLIDFRLPEGVASRRVLQQLQDMRRSVGA